MKTYNNIYLISFWKERFDIQTNTDFLIYNDIDVLNSISKTFDWEFSNEGWDYWNNIHKHLIALTEERIYGKIASPH